MAKIIPARKIERCGECPNHYLLNDRMGNFVTCKIMHTTWESLSIPSWCPLEDYKSGRDIAQEIREELEQPCNCILPDGLADPLANIKLLRECKKCLEFFWQKWEEK